MRRGKLVFEQYFSGPDYPRGLPDGRYTFDAASKHDMQSISKSITSLLIGITIDRKLIASVPSRGKFCFNHKASPIGSGRRIKTESWRGRQVCACAHEMLPGSASSCSIRESGTAGNSFRLRGLHNQRRKRFQAIGYFGGLFYGYQRWLGRTLSGEKEVTWIAAEDLGGQQLFIVPEADLIVMTTSGLCASPRQGQAALDILYSFVIPSIRDAR